MANLKNITDLPVAESAEGLNLIVEDNGSAKRIAAGAVGAQADFAVTDETSPAFIKNKPEVAQADWNQNAPSAADYVKNRTHYEDVLSEYVCFEGELSLNGTATASIDYTIPAGTIVEQYFNGSLLCTVTAFASGDKVIASEGRIRADFKDNTVTVGNYYSNGTIKIVARNLGVLKELDEKYIPKTIARTADVPSTAVLYTEQTLTEEQQEQARANIGAVSANYFDQTFEQIFDDIDRTVDSMVRHDEAQDLTDEQKAQARANIGAAAEDETGGGGIPIPTTAEVGQTIVVKAVDESGKPTEWECADLPSNDHINSLIDAKLGVIENGTY